MKRLVKRWTIPILVTAVATAAFFVYLRHYAVISHSDCSFPIRVTGVLVASTDGSPIANTFVMTAPSQPAAAAWITSGQYRERIDEWLQYEDAEEEAGRGPASPRSAPWGAGGARTHEDGTFTIVQTLLWSYDRAGWWQSRPSHPPPCHGIEALAIEIEGRDPVILDVPEGTWTEHDGDDGLWATWDLGVVEVP